MTMTITAQSREANAPLEALREAGQMPAVYYGQGQDAVSITVDRQEMISLYKEAGTSTIIDLETPQGVQKVLIHDYQVHPVSHKLLHVDFMVVDMTKPIQVAISLEFIGEAPAEQDGLGILNTALDEVEIEVPATDLPSHIDVDLSVLKTLDDAIHAGDIKIPASATLITDAEALVVKVSEQKEEAEEESSEMDLSSIQSETGNAKSDEADGK
ncbi:50S ribosomal protein L25 [Candidatus Nomurabacteria bacterium]|nr:50S ribosomal protein L25 [Candidatus Nomurabacteria bacterium]